MASDFSVADCDTSYENNIKSSYDLFQMALRMSQELDDEDPGYPELPDLPSPKRHGSEGEVDRDLKRSIHHN
jgi:hypothetical protein